MGRLTQWFGCRSVPAFADKARQKLATGKLDDAATIVERGLERFPGSSALLDLRLSIRRARAHKSMRRLENRIEAGGDPLAYEELIKLYHDLELPDEAQRKAKEYCDRHPDHDAPHMVIGEMYLDLFLEELSARHGHLCHEHLLRASNLNTMALRPRLLLAELYFCIDARRSLAPLLTSLRQMAPETSAMEAAFEVMERIADPHADEKLEGLFERIEVTGQLDRDPSDWPLSKRSKTSTAIKEDAIDPVVAHLVDQGTVDEVVLLRSDGSLMTQASPTGTRGGTDDDDSDEADGTLIGGETGERSLVSVVRTVSAKVFTQARELDMGKFKRFTIRGRFGNLVVGKVGNVMVGMRGPGSSEPSRMWERVSGAIEGASRKGSP